MMASQPVFVIDWDGTLVSDHKYPEQGDWLPGAVDALHELLKHGRVKISTLRLNPYEVGHDGDERYRRDSEDVEDHEMSIREMLDDQGLEAVEIHTTRGKPAGTFYIDNQAVEFDGSWEKVLERVTGGSRHSGSERFHQILAELGSLHDQKQKDYGTDQDPFANVRSTADWGIPAWVGALVRLADKVQRLKSMVRKGYLANESVEDSMRDIAVYAAIALVLYEEEAPAEAGAACQAG